MCASCAPAELSGRERDRGDRSAEALVASGDADRGELDAVDRGRAQEILALASFLTGRVTVITSAGRGVG